MPLYKSSYLLKIWDSISTFYLIVEIIIILIFYKNPNSFYILSVFVFVILMILFLNKVVFFNDRIEIIYLFRIMFKREILYYNQVDKIIYKKGGIRTLPHINIRLKDSNKFTKIYTLLTLRFCIYPTKKKKELFQILETYGITIENRI